MEADRDPVVVALLDAARAVQAKAYAPYSHFPVGAALVAPNGQIYAGCNIENAALPEGLCAEAGAIAAMVADGQHRIVQMVTICDGDDVSTCCGGCRQKIREFATPATLIHAATPKGIARTYTMAELLPDSFGPEHLEGFVR